LRKKNQIPEVNQDKLAVDQLGDKSIIQKDFSSFDKYTTPITNLIKTPHLDL
jgi:hypothetical protein